MDKLEKYADLVVKVGINLQKGQTLWINSPIECCDLARLILKKAYLQGAKNVYIDWNDEESSLIKYLHAPDESFEEYPMWRANGLEEVAKNGGAFLSISASNPDLLKDVNPKKIATFNKTASLALKGYRKYTMSSTVSWCVISAPTKAWAKKIFSELSEEEAMSKLWDSIFNIVRCDKENPVSAWTEHLSNLENKVNYLNNTRFESLHLKSDTCDLVVKLPKEHIWCGGGENNAKNTYFVANMPTEEVFTTPLKTGVNGYVKSTKPFNYGGNLIEDFKLTFKDGKVIDIEAKTGYEILKNLIVTDEGASFLGEIALVPHNSPISNLNIVFFNTLFDENASCHLALGSAYPTCIKDGNKLSIDELTQNGSNYSLIHEDFMIGSPSLNIIGTTYDKEEIQIFKDGNWSI